MTFWYICKICRKSWRFERRLRHEGHHWCVDCAGPLVESDYGAVLRGAFLRLLRGRLP